LHQTIQFLRSFHRFIFLFALLVCLCLNANAKEHALNDTAAIYDLFRLADQQTNPDSAILIFKVVLQKAIEINYAYICNGTLLRMGEEYINKGNYIQALECMKQALPYNSGLPLIEKSNYFQHLGWVYVELGDYVTAAQNFYTALDYFRKSGELRPNEISLCNDLGQVYFKLHQNEKALFYYNTGEAYGIKLRSWGLSINIG